MSPTTTEMQIEDDLDLNAGSQINEAERAEKYAADLETQYAVLPMAIFADVRSKRIKHRDVCLYVHLLVKQGGHRSTFWGVDSLAILTGTNDTSIKDSLRRLVQSGHIERKRSIGTSHTYCLTRVPRGKGAGGILVKGRKIGEAPTKEDEAKPIQSPVPAMRQSVPIYAPARPSWNAPSIPRDPRTSRSEPYDFSGDVEGFLASTEGEVFT